MAKHVLIIDDDAGLLQALVITFETAGYRVSTAVDGDAGLVAIGEGAPDAVISDVNMPGTDGFTLCTRVRATGNQVPFIILTSRDSEIDEALGLELGADDYLSKPFSTRILLARVKALLRREEARAGSTASASGVQKVDMLELDLERLDVIYGGKPVRVTLSEFRLLEALSKRPGIVLSRGRLLDLIRADDSVVGDRIIDTYVRRLRRKFEEIEPSFDRIETVIGAGYRWRDDGAAT